MSHNDDKEAVKTQIRALCDQIRKAGSSSIEWAPLEWDIAKLIIDYSIRHDIVIPLVDYERYKRRDAVAENIERLQMKSRFLVGVESLMSPEKKSKNLTSVSTILSTQLVSVTVRIRVSRCIRILRS